MLNNDFIEWSDKQTGLDLFKDFVNEKYYQDHGEQNERDLIEEIGYQNFVIAQALSLIGPRLEEIEKTLQLLHPDYKPPKEGPKPPKGKKV